MMKSIHISGSEVSIKLCNHTGLATTRTVIASHNETIDAFDPRVKSIMKTVRSMYGAAVANGSNVMDIDKYYRVIIGEKLCMPEQLKVLVKNKQFFAFDSDGLDGQTILLFTK
jgi:hypothetical protein